MAYVEGMSVKSIARKKAAENRSDIRRGLRHRACEIAWALQRNGYPKARFVPGSLTDTSMEIDSISRGRLTLRSNDGGESYRLAAQSPEEVVHLGLALEGSLSDSDPRRITKTFWDEAPAAKTPRPPPPPVAYVYSNLPEKSFGMIIVRGGGVVHGEGGNTPYSPQMVGAAAALQWAKTTGADKLEICTSDPCVLEDACKTLLVAETRELRALLNKRSYTARAAGSGDADYMEQAAAFSGFTESPGPAPAEKPAPTLVPSGPIAYLHAEPSTQSYGVVIVHRGETFADEGRECLHDPLMEGAASALKWARRVGETNLVFCVPDPRPLQAAAQSMVVHAKSILRPLVDDAYAARAARPEDAARMAEAAGMARLPDSKRTLPDLSRLPGRFSAASVAPPGPAQTV
jgi:hypothetical protein